ncbi:hypothetical protein COT78_02030 [Candidatus Berkelbacteria bacterium CG10_big_fil_rev_8_21_14_0_10_43_13]|uniref:Peptidase M23 domain-containing protein n=1 Tax=Candidatus Berkelbacteria bacterium CG10_big_fil_rev_8_21_14_0_10_43_13 TaxID=1974514 RepID=A0A2H0W6M2_9BACT|nr:MAG: hypothetical protein COT78_02030 [Candidatus Berkelbacteria bacterium CG10_big_fil_rev_8_21_14_0_10_43_13]
MEETELKSEGKYQNRKKPLIILVIVVVVAIVVVAAQKIKRGHSDQGSNSDTGNQLALSSDPAIAAGQDLSGNRCEGTEKPLLTNLPMNESDFAFILPYGMTIGAHVTPIDHQYFSPTVFNSPRDTYPVFAMADATIVNIEPRKTDRGTEYRMVFSISCKLFYYYDLVTSLDPSLMTLWQEAQNKSRPFLHSVKAGEEIGRIGGQTLDFAVWDMDKNLSGFVEPEHYISESWKIHTVDPLDYYTDDLKTKVLSKYLRTTEPRSGKIDYDIDGKLVGTWFLQGTNGYKGVNQSNYWVGHLSVAYDYLDPASIVISTGDYGGEAMQFGVSGNTPDPASVDVTSGMIKYELVQQDWADSSGQKWDRSKLTPGIRAKNPTGVLGVALFQLQSDGTLKAEFFPSKTGAQVSSFDNNAEIFER